MKKLTLCALAVMSINAYATVEHFNTKEWTTGEGAQGHMEIIEESITELTPDEKKNLSYRVTAKTKPYYERSHTTAALQGQHSIDVVNQTRQRQTYQVTLYLCVLSRNCYNNTFTIYLNSGYRYFLKTNSLLNWATPYSGNFTLQAGSRTTGVENGFAYDNQPLVVS
jgi:hypothetical protein